VLRIRAGRIHPVTSPPIDDGAVLIDGGGRISAIGPHSRVAQPRRGTALHFPDAELLPGLVNCHTHLELSHLGGGVKHAEPEFLKWIRRIRELKEQTSAEQFDEAAAAGVRDCWARGVTCVAETGSTGAVMRALHDLGGRGIVYQEVFGPDPAKAGESMSELLAVLQPLRRLATSQLVVGVSPHAPYTVSRPLYEAAAGFARRERLPVAVHVAESREEVALVCDGAGPFAEALDRRGISVVTQRCSPVAYLVRLGVIGRGTLCIHCVHVDDADIELLRAIKATVAHCPRSNLEHSAGVFPLKRFREAAIPVGIGTDSIVSVGDLDLWADAEAAGLRGDAAIRALTIEGARALGWDQEIGSLEVGKAGDVIVQTVGPLRSAQGEPSGRPAVLLTVVSGKIVHQISGQ
jgi:5-methylthioadenosine/S-adenosylhomocysteine deaminase